MSATFADRDDHEDMGWMEPALGPERPPPLFGTPVPARGLCWNPGGHGLGTTGSQQPVGPAVEPSILPASGCRSPECLTDSSHFPGRRSKPAATVPLGVPVIAAPPVHREEAPLAVESSGKSAGNPRLYELIEDSPKEGASPTIWAWPQIIDYLKVASQPVQGPWPPHQNRRPDPDAESMPTAVPDSRAANPFSNP